MTSIKFYKLKLRSKRDAEFQSLQQISFHLVAVWLSGNLDSVSLTEQNVPLLGIKKHFNLVS